MKKEEINRLIAEFMGLAKQDMTNDGGKIYLYESPESGNYIPIEEVNYNSSPDWLMPVLDKIEDAGFDTEINCTHGIEKEKLYIVEITDLKDVFHIFVGIGPNRLKALLTAITDYINELNLKF